MTTIERREAGVWVSAIVFGALVVLLCLPAVAGAQTGPGDNNLDKQSAQPEAASEPPEKLMTVLDEILVTAAAPTGPVGTAREIDREAITEVPLGDAAEVLRNVSGLSLGRMGGHGLEPRLRGLGETNLNVVLDGAYVHSACPNRMDPPTSFGAVESFERVVVLKGVQTLRYGGGGSGGTILYQRETPRFRDDERWRLSLGSAVATHSAAPDFTLDAATGFQSGYLRVIGEHRDVNSYKDGGGNEVRSAFEKRDANVFLGWTPDPESVVELSYENNYIQNALFPGAGMDAPRDENDLYRLKARRLRSEGVLTAIETELYWGEIDHLMDNYSLRPLTGMAMAAPTFSDTWGGRAGVDVRAGERLRLTVGADLQVNNRRAVRLAGPDPGTVTREQSILWPDATVRDSGVFFEGIREFEAGHRLRFGLRADRWTARIAEADREPFGTNLTPRDLYLSYYGDGASGWEHDDVAGLLRYEHNLRPGLTLFTGLSRSVRPADATERFLASNGAQPASRWVGNPGLEAEQHHQLDLGVSFLADARQVSALAFLDRVTDYILRDRARGQEGILQRDLATVYRNVDAELYGFELDVWQRLTEHLALVGNASWVHADDVDDGRPLAQIPPLQGRLRTDFAHGAWGAAATLRYAFKQTRVDDDPATGSGLDAGEIPGYTIFDLLGTYSLSNGLQLHVGVENVLDKLYANHLNRGSVFDPEQVRVNEPGRTFWLKLRYRAGG